MLLTGKDIHEATAEVNSEKGDVALVDWGQLRWQTQEKYNAVAERLNAQLSKAGEEAKKVIFSEEMVHLLLDEAIIKGLLKLQLHPEQEYTEEMATSYLTDTLELVANVLPDEIRSLVRRIVSLYQIVTKED